MTLRPLAVLTAVLALSGCATKPGECDATNRDSSMLTKMNCDYSGGYSDQVKQKEQALSASRQENAMFRQVYENIQAQQLSTKTDLASQQKSQASQLLSSLKTRHANESQVQKQIAGLEQQLKASQAAPVTKASPATLAAKKEQLKVLQKKVNQLQFSLGYEE
jgi:ATPase subunit of ABC transporter with duplicated ATPase domains